MSPGAASSGKVWRLALYTVGLWTLCGIVWRYAFLTWFSMDDFAWLGLPLEVPAEGVWKPLFRPQAQGTVRIFSERVFFLGLTSAFGMNVIPFKIVVFATQFANLSLIAVIARKLTGLPLAGVAASILYLFNSALTVPMLWLSAYNEILWTLVLLSAFYCLLRWIETGQTRYNALQWIIFILGFGVLELNVVYPAIAALYAFFRARRHLVKVLPLFLPSVAFAIAHYTLVPHSDSPIYRLYFDSTLFVTFGGYAGWAIGPSRMRGLVGPEWAMAGYIVTGLIAFAIAAFAWVAGGRLALFLLGWFAIVVAPIVPLKNHITDYYLTAAVVGPCLLGGWMVASAWKHSRVFATVATLLLAGYCTGHYMQMDAIVTWRFVQSGRMKTLFTGVAEIFRRSPREMVLLSGVDRDLYLMGFNDQPFRLLGIQNTYLLPGVEEAIRAEGGAAGLDRYVISPGLASRAVAQGQAYVIRYTDSGVADITADYKATASNAPGTDEFINVGLEASSSSLGEGWFPIENRFRWMGPKATVKISARTADATRLVITGYCPQPTVAAGPIVITFTANGRKLGGEKLATGNQPFTYTYPIDRALALAKTIEIVITVDRPTRLPDGRDVGVIFGTFAVQ